MSIETLMKEIIEALPPMSRQRSVTVREVALFFDDKVWRVMAGGHAHVELGEWGGDYSSWGNTPEDALATCLRHIRASK